VPLTACDILKAIGTKQSLAPLSKVVEEKDFFLTPKAKEAIQAINARP
jgi:hypothetical protein